MILQMQLTLNATPNVTTAKPPIQALLFCTKSLANLDDDMMIYDYSTLRLVHIDASLCK